jgi:hypothetical protein
MRSVSHRFPEYQQAKSAPTYYRLVRHGAVTLQTVRPVSLPPWLERPGGLSPAASVSTGAAACERIRLRADFFAGHAQQTRLQTETERRLSTFDHEPLVLQALAHPLATVALQLARADTDGASGTARAFEISTQFLQESRVPR